MIEIRPTVWPDVEALLANLCEIHTKEIADNGWTEEDFKGRLARFLALSAESHTMLLDGVPQWMFAVQKSQEFGAVTWLLLAQSYFDKGFPAIRAGRRHFKGVVARHGQLTSFVAIPGDDVDRWMRWHGYELVEKCAKYRRYICR